MGNTPVVSEELIICVTVGSRAEEMVCRRLDGIGSSGQVVGREPSRSLETSSSARRENERSEALLAGCCRLSWSGSENWLLMAETLSVKNEANMSAVSRVEVRGGLRSELKTENIFLASVAPQNLF